MRESFDLTWPNRWRIHRCGSAALARIETGLRLVNTPTSGAVYANAQIDDYQGLARSRFPWRPPLTLTVRARFSHESEQLSGTAGFGFWNDPFAMSGSRRLTLPRALWFFFAAPPSNMALAANVPGWGWKAATIDALRWPFAALLPTAPLGMLLVHSQKLYQRLWPIAQAAMAVDEAQVDASMTDWHLYRIIWGEKLTVFQVDGRFVLETRRSPAGPLGLVLWLDNQYMVVTPQGRFAHGLTAKKETQWLEIGEVAVIMG